MPAAGSRKDLTALYSDGPVYAVIGKNYGDEGKGLAADYFVSRRTVSPSEALVIRHNGGAQAGHTVDLKDGGRFVFHQLSSGSFRGARTLWADTFMPDLYKLGDEISDFKALCELPKIFASLNSCPVLIYDVLLNQAIEDARADKRHGSCGMGINEAKLRIRAGFGISMEEFLGSSAKSILIKLAEIRNDYVGKRLAELEDEAQLPQEYIRLLNDKNLLLNYIDECLYNAEKISGADDKGIRRLIGNSSGIIFEGAQGLLLDEDYEQGAPHLTASKTGLHNPLRFSERFGLKLTEVCYVSRSYVTRHGNGPLPMEFTADAASRFTDRTNITNKWQGTLRYASHESASFVPPVEKDMSVLPEEASVSLMLTHLNETDGKLLTEDAASDVESVPGLKKIFTKIYRSYSPFAEDVQVV